MTFGTLTAALDIASQVYAAAIDAVDGLPVRALLTAGQYGKSSALEHSSRNVRVEQWVNEVDVLAEAAAVVCHGGAKSILGALAAGLPLVVVPLFADQHLNARLLSATGAGVVAKPDADSIRNAILQVLHDDSHRLHARTLGRELRTHAPCKTVVELLGKLATDATAA